MGTTVALAARKGFALASLYEVDTNFAQVVSDLKLDVLSAENEARIRGKFAEVIGRGLQRIELSKKLNPGGKLQARDVIATLKTIERNFKAVEPILRGLETGIRHTHQIEVASRIKGILDQNPELKVSGDNFLSDFCNRMNTVSEACLVAASDLKSVRAKAGQKPIDWYDDFTHVLVFIAKLNNIRTTIQIDRVTGKSGGRFLELAAAFEQLLYPKMRSPSRAGMATRLSRSLRRVK
jgi:hypothetical protein